MFKSFFPNPPVFFGSALLWTAICIALWFLGISEWGAGFFKDWVPAAVEGASKPFLTSLLVWTYIYIALAGVLFCVFWAAVGHNKWYRWSVIGSTTIVLVSYYNIQISVYMNSWYGSFYNLMQKALTTPHSVTAPEFYGQLITIVPILVANIIALVLLDFFVSHYVFRWRTAMNNYYMENWPRLRHIEGAAQRVQEDTMRFARIVEGLGISFVSSLMTLIAFLPLLYTLSHHVTALPFFGKVDGSMVYVALVSAAMGTVLLAVVGVKLPGLEFKNQKVEAAFRKELVYGEDNEDRAQPLTAAELFANVRKNYYTLYFHYLYFGIARWAYLQGANFIPLVALGPTILSGAITFGIFQQINNAFTNVESSFKFFATAWTTIIDLISVHKRLVLFESAITDESLTPVSDEWVEQSKIAVENNKRNSKKAV